eukprot:gene39413-22339_t
MAPHGIPGPKPVDRHRYCGTIKGKDGVSVQVRWDDPPDGPPKARPVETELDPDIPEGPPRIWAADAHNLLGVSSGALYEKVFMPMWRLLIPIAVRHRSVLAAF